MVYQIKIAGSLTAEYLASLKMYHWYNNSEKISTRDSAGTVRDKLLNCLLGNPNPPKYLKHITALTGLAATGATYATLTALISKYLVKS